MSELGAVARSKLAALRFSDGRATRVQEEVAAEEPLEIRIVGDPWLVTLRTPGRDHELVMGLLHAEGLVQSRDDVGTLVHCGRPGEAGYGNVIDVRPAPGATFDAELTAASRRALASSAACGICGRRSIDDLLSRALPLDDALAVDPRSLSELAHELRRQQPDFARTGGLHAAGIATAGATSYRVVREDVGRHNAVDKAIGRLLLDGAAPSPGCTLVVSGRAGFEIVSKAVVARIPVLVAIGAPSSLAVATAERARLTLVGFCRDGSFNVYSGAERLGYEALDAQS
jgi:FdhD protein